MSTCWNVGIKNEKIANGYDTTKITGCEMAQLHIYEIDIFTIGATKTVPYL